MPYLNIKTNADPKQLDADSAVKTASKICAEALGKPEGYVQVSLISCPMCFGGDDSPCAYAELWSIGLPPDAPARLTPELCAFFTKHLQVPQDRVYINFQNIDGARWGWNGQTFG